MKKLLKIAAGFAAVFVLLIIIAAAAVRIFFPPEKAKAMLVKAAETHLHRKVELGEVSVGLFSGLTVADFKLSERPDFSQGTFVSSSKLAVRPRLLPLLSKKLFIKEVELLKPQITITRFPDGKTYNFSDFQRASEKASSAPDTANSPEVVSPLSFLVSHARLQSGTLHFQDLSPAQQSIDIVGLNLEADNVSLIGPMELKLKVGVKKQNMEADVDFGGSLQYLKGVLQMTRCRLVARTGSKDESIANVTGEIRRLFGASSEKTKPEQAGPEFDVKVKIERLHPSLITAFSSFPADVGIQGPLSGNVNLTGTATSMNFASALNLDQTVIKYDSYFRKPTGQTMALETNGTYSTPTAVDFKNLKLALGKMEFAGNGNYVSQPKNSSYRFDFKSNVFPLAELANAVPPVQEYHLQGNATLLTKMWSGAAGSPSSGFQMTGTLTLKEAAMAYEQVQLAQLQGPLQFTLDSVSTTKLAGQMNGSPFTLDLSAHKLSSHPVIKTALNIHTLDLGKLISNEPKAVKQQKSDIRPAGFNRIDRALAAVLFVQPADAAGLSAAGPAAAGSTGGFMSRPMDFSGVLTAEEVQHEYLKGKNLRLNWDLTNLTEDLNKLGGTASLKQGPGDIQNIQKLTEGSRMARMFLLPLSLLQKLDKATKGVLKLPSFDRLSFQEILGDYTFRSGVMNVEKFVMNGSQLNADMKGTIGLAGAQKVDLKAMLKLPEGAVGGTAGQLLQDDQGRATISMNVTGTVSEPVVKVETKEIKQKAIEKIKEQVGEEKIKKVEDLLKGLFKK